jgi:hypothetical protein
MEHLLDPGCRNGASCSFKNIMVPSVCKAGGAPFSCSEYNPDAGTLLINIFTLRRTFSNIQKISAFIGHYGGHVFFPRGFAGASDI